MEVVQVLDEDFAVVVGLTGTLLEVVHVVEDEYFEGSVGLDQVDE